MQSTQQPIFFLTIPSTAATGQARIAIGNQIPAVLQSWGTTNNVVFSAVVLEYFGFLGDAFKFNAVGQFQSAPCYFEGTWDSGNGVYILRRDAITGTGFINSFIGSQALNTFTLQYQFLQTVVQVLDNGNGNSGVQISGSLTQTVNTPGRVDAIFNGAVQAWQAMSLVNGWANQGAGDVSAQFRLVAAPSNEVEVIGSVSGGTNANGTTIATLPVGYRPVTVQSIVIFATNTTTPTQVPRMALTTAGQLQIVNCTTAGQIIFHGLFSLDA